MFGRALYGPLGDPDLYIPNLRRACSSKDRDHLTAWSTLDRTDHRASGLPCRARLYLHERLQQSTRRISTLPRPPRAPIGGPGDLPPFQLHAGKSTSRNKDGRFCKGAKAQRPNGSLASRPLKADDAGQAHPAHTTDGQATKFRICQRRRGRCHHLLRESCTRESITRAMRPPSPLDGTEWVRFVCVCPPEITSKQWEEGPPPLVGLVGGMR